MDPLCPPVYLLTSCMKQVYHIKQWIFIASVIDNLGKKQTFHVIIESTLITPSDPPKATRGTSPTADLERNSILKEPQGGTKKQSTKYVKNKNENYRYVNVPLYLYVAILHYYKITRISVKEL